MTSILPIVITILSSGEDYVFIERKKDPYSGLWSLVGGKLQPGEHIQEAAVREVMEETGSEEVLNYKYCGLVSERLVDKENHLKAHFLIFVGKAEVIDFVPEHIEGRLKAFSKEDIHRNKEEFIPSDWYMFKSFESDTNSGMMYDAELRLVDNRYNLIYYRKA